MCCRRLRWKSKNWSRFLYTDKKKCIYIREKNIPTGNNGNQLSLLLHTNILACKWVFRYFILLLLLGGTCFFSFFSLRTYPYATFVFFWFFFSFFFDYGCESTADSRSRKYFNDPIKYLYTHVLFRCTREEAAVHTRAIVCTTSSSRVVGGTRSVSADTNRVSVCIRDRVTEDSMKPNRFPSDRIRHRV